MLDTEEKDISFNSDYEQSGKTNDGGVEQEVEAKPQKKAARNSNLELLRIISMFLIVMSHCDDWTGIASLYGNGFSVNRCISDFFNAFGQIGVGCLVLITGYFSINQKFSLKRLLRLWGEVIFYSATIWLIYLIVSLSSGAHMYGFSLWISAKLAFFPVIFSHYWFFSAYVILMLLMPFINPFIKSMNKRTYQLFLLVLIVIFFIIEGGIIGALSDMIEGGRIPSFIIMYFVGAYIRLHVDNSKMNPGRHFLVALLAAGILYASFILLAAIGYHFNNSYLIDNIYYLRPLNSPLVLIVNVELFFTFLRMKPRSNKFINAVAGTMFGVYLIHGNKIIARYVLPIIFPLYKITHPSVLFVSGIAVTVTVCCLCALIDFIRQKTVEKLWVKFLDAYADRIQNKITRFFCAVRDKTMMVIKKYYK